MKNQIAVLTFAFTILISGNASADLGAGLVARWTFDNCTGADSVGRKHDGTLFGSSSACVISPANNNAFLFNGSDNYFKIATSSDFNISTKASYSAWVNPSKFTGSAIINKWVNGLEDKAIWLGSNGKFSTYFWDCMNRTVLSSNTKISLNKWSHVVATYDGSNVKLYLNGALNATVATDPSCNVGDSTGSLYLGDNPERRAEGSEPFQGALDDVRVYNRALSATEVQQLYFQVFPPPINGTAAWGTAHTVTCQNLTQGTQKTLPATTASAWNCEATGLKFKSGDNARVIINGKRY
jgi:hypothetical protein